MSQTKSELGSATHPLLQRSGAIGTIRPKRTAALQGLRELVGLFEVLQRIRIIDSIMEPGRAQSVPGINTEWAAIGRAGCQDLGLTPLIADRGKAPGRRSVAEGDALNLNRQKSPRMRCCKSRTPALQARTTPLLR